MVRQDFSFVIPAYNDAKGLKRHLDFFSTRPEPIQLVIVDDCSTDNTEEVVRGYEGLPGNVEVLYHRQPTNQGAGPARNTGMELAERDLLMFLDADDELASCFFDYIRLSPLANGADLVLFKYHLAEGPEQRFSYVMHDVDNAVFSCVPNGVPPGLVRLRDRLGVLTTVNFPWNKLYRREFLRQSGIRFPDIRMHEDITPHWQSFLRADRFGIMSFAPPLITHYEAAGGTRATNYVGEHRLGVFPELARLQDEIQAHEQAAQIAPQFQHFVTQLTDWMIDTLCAGSDEESRLWWARYSMERERWWDTMGFDSAKAG